MTVKENPKQLSLSHRLLMGVMIVTAFLSMWISNSASTAMMLPITNAILEQLKEIEMQIEDEHQKAAEDDPSLELDASETQEQSSGKEEAELEHRAGT